MDTGIIRVSLPSDKSKYISPQVKTRSTTAKTRNRVNVKLASHTVKRVSDENSQSAPRIETPAEQVLERRSQVPYVPDSSVQDSYHTPAVPQTGYTTSSSLLSSLEPESHSPDDPSVNPNPCRINTPGIKWGCLKNGALPTYRTYRRTHGLPPIPTVPIGDPPNVPLPPPPPTYSILDYSISPTPIRNLDIPVTPVTTADLLAQQRADRVLHTPKPKMPLQKRTIRRTRVTGMSKDKKEVRVQLTSKDSIPTPDPESISISDMKRYLYHRKLITLTSSAPVDLIRELYQTAIASDWNEPAPE